MNALQRDLKKLVPLVESLGAERVESDPHRQRFHVQPTVGWLNDPNGLCRIGPGTTRSMTMLNRR